MSIPDPDELDTLAATKQAEQKTRMEQEHAEMKTKRENETVEELRETLAVRMRKYADADMSRVWCLKESNADTLVTELEALGYTVFKGSATHCCGCPTYNVDAWKPGTYVEQDDSLP